MAKPVIAVSAIRQAIRAVERIESRAMRLPPEAFLAAVQARERLVAQIEFATGMSILDNEREAE